MVQRYQSITHVKYENPGAARETWSESYTNVPLRFLPDKSIPPTTVDTNLYHFGWRWNTNLLALNVNASLTGKTKVRRQYIWYTLLQLKLIFQQLQQREMCFSYLKSLGNTIPWIFALDHYHYARWMTIHVRGLLALENTCPTTHAQVHKQLNAMVKGNG